MPTHGYIPKCSTKDIKEVTRSLHFPQPESTSFSASEDSLHQIVVLEWSEQGPRDMLAARRTAPRSDDPSTSLILCIAGRKTSHAKNENEATALIWVALNTSIPVPRIVCHDSTTNNPLHEEYMIMKYANGIEDSKLYPRLTDESMVYLLDQLVEHVIQLYRSSLNHMGGLKTMSEK